MLQINLIRDRAELFRRRTVILAFVYAGVFVLLLYIIIGSSVYLSNFYRMRTCKKEIDRLNAQIADLGFPSLLTREYKSRWGKLSSQLSLIDEIMQERVLWAPKLQAINTTLPADMWLSKIYLQEKTKKRGLQSPDRQALILEGFVLSKQGRELVHLKDFISNLKKSSVFMKGLKGVELSSTKGEKMGETEVMAFQLSCPLSKE